MCDVRFVLRMVYCWNAPCEDLLQRLSLPTAMPKTRSPRLKRVTLAPMPTTVPATSLPKMKGSCIHGVIRERASRSVKSKGLTATAATEFLVMTAMQTGIRTILDEDLVISWQSVRCVTDLDLVIRRKPSSFVGEGHYRLQCGLYSKSTRDSGSSNQEHNQTLRHCDASLLIRFLQTEC
jgi:hypothetical protein